MDQFVVEGNCFTKERLISEFSKECEAFKADLERFNEVAFFFCGNPARADDGSGYRLFKRLTKFVKRSEIENIHIHYDLQWNIEDVLDLTPLQLPVFIDNTLDKEPPASLKKICCAEGPSIFSHSISPPQLLQVAKQIEHPCPDYLWQLAIAGYDFELGNKMTLRCETTTNSIAEMLEDFLQNWGRTSAG